MAESNNSSALHWILGAALLLIALFVVVALVGVNSQAGEINSSAGVTNAAPTVDNIYFNSTNTYWNADGASESDGIIELNSGSDLVMNITGAVSDTNGDSDISNVELVFYSAGAPSGATCSIDPNDCYKIASCGTSALDNDSLKYNCAINLSFWTNSSMAGGAEAATDWTAKVDVVDSQGSKGYLTDTIDVATNLSLTMPGPINWGTLAQGESTSNTTNEDQTITQAGNDKGDINISGTSMPCSNTGTIPKENIKYDLADDGHTSGGAALSGTPTLLDITIPYQLAPSAVTDKISWEILIPAYDVSGLCTGTITMAAVASAD